MTITDERTDAPAAAHPDAPAARLLLPNDATREEWKAARLTGIGGSEVAAILGMDKYRGPRHVYEAKHGREDEVTSEAAGIGSRIEKFIVDEFSMRSGVPVATPPGTFANLERPWMRANVDAFGLWDEETRAVAGPVEAKNRSEYQLDDWETEAPDAPSIQCYWYMGVGGWDVGWPVALVGGNKLKYYRLERDEELIEQLIDHCGAWFKRHVIEGIPPEADGLETTTELLAKLWSVKPEQVAEIDRSKAKELRARHFDLAARMKALDTELTAVGNQMRDIAGENEVMKSGTLAAWSWKKNGNFAHAKFSAAEPELAAEYTYMVPAIDASRLEEELPDVYAKYRARVLRVPKKGA